MFSRGFRRSLLSGLTLVVALGVAPTIAATPAAAAAADPPPPTRTITSPGNPIIGDGSLYTADAAPLVGDDGRLYLYTGHDEASTNQASFVMRDYNVLATDDPASGEWDVYQGNLKPGEVFDWATGNSAFAGHAVRGPDDRYYWYVPVQWENTAVPNRMAIGVAVADSPVGPWTDALGSPLLTWTDVFGSSTNGQEVIDPHVFFDDDGKTYLYWGSWNVARVVELSSMTQRTGEIRTLSGLTGFFEAPWVVKRNGIYHMVYDWKQGGSACTPSNYQACIGWATATSPLGPWTYQGIVMDAASATTMHPSIIEFEGQWYITYHTKDAVGGGHFRRSVAIDEMEWDGDTILPIERTLADDPDFRLTDNVALAATPAASFTEQPPMRLGAVNDGFRATTALLPPDQWGNYRGTTSSNRSDWVSYQWDAPVRVDSAGIQFHQDGNWIRPPESWRIEYLDEGGAWQPVPNAVVPTPANNVWHNVTFDPVTTTALRATFNGRPNGAYFHSVSVSEWEVYAVDGVIAPDVEVVTEPGVAPELPEAVRATAGDTELWAPVNWRDVDPADYAAEGSFTVEGRALGVTGDLVTATVVVDEDAVVTPTPDAAPPVVSIGLSGTQGADGWFSSNVVARVRAEDAVDYRTTIETRIGDGAWTPVEDARYADVTVTESGTTVVSGRATDGAGNASEPVTRSVKVDKVLPTADATLDPEARTVTVTASDALSGLGSSEYRFDTGTWQPLTLGTPVAAPDGLPHTFTYRVPDLAGNVRSGSVQIPLDPDAELTGNIAEYATPTASFASSWAPVTNLNDGTNDPLENNAGEVGGGWGTWPQVGEQWVRYSWSFDVTTDRAGVWWDSDQPDTGNAGLIPPRSWTLEYLDADGTTWRPVTLTGESTYGRARGAFNEVRFEPVTTRALRVVGQSWGEESGQGSMGIREWQVIAAPRPTPSRRRSRPARWP